MVNLVVYQAAATVIPTLLVAMVLTGRLFENIRQRKGAVEAGVSDIRPAALLFIYIGFAVYGEMAALMILAKGSGNELARGLPLIAIVTMLAAIFDVGAQVILSQYKGVEQALIRAIYFAAFMIAPDIFVLVKIV